MTSKHYADDYSDDDLDFDEDYFERTYRPLSSLPTPPPSCRESPGTETPRSLLEDEDLLDSQLLGPAIHLVNLVPAKASLAVPSVVVVHNILRRANLPLDTIALAVCILDSLNAKSFSTNWRFACPLVRADALSKRHTLPAGGPIPSQLNIDCVNPEVIILSSLMVAFKFLEDTCHEPTRYYNTNWGDNTWTDGQINATERCVVEALDYRILPLWNEELIGDAVADMQRAGRQAIASPRLLTASQERRADECHKRSMSSGKAVYGIGHQITPVETPGAENSPLGSLSAAHADDARAAFGLGSLRNTSLELPLEVRLKPLSLEQEL